MLAVVRRGGFEAETVANGIDAIAILAREHFSVIVLDLLLPRGSGYDVLEWLQNGYASVLPRVIILSATSPSIVRKHAVARSVFRIMQKPFDIEELLEAVRACATHRDHGRFAAVRMKSSQANADAAVLAVVAPERDALHLVWSYGYEEEKMAKFNPLALSVKAPLSTAVLEARPVWLRSRRELADEYPLLEPALQPSTRAMAAVPIVDRGEVAGSIGWRFAEEQRFERDQQELLLSIAEECAPLSRTETAG